MCWTCWKCSPPGGRASNRIAHHYPRQRGLTQCLEPLRFSRAGHVAKRVGCVHGSVHSRRHRRVTFARTRWVRVLSVAQDPCETRIEAHGMARVACGTTARDLGRSPPRLRAHQGPLKQWWERHALAPPVISFCISPSSRLLKAKDSSPNHALQLIGSHHVRLDSCAQKGSARAKANPTSGEPCAQNWLAAENDLRIPQRSFIAVTGFINWDSDQRKPTQSLVSARFMRAYVAIAH